MSLICTLLFQGIKKAREIILTQGRANAPEVIIVITDGKSTFYPQTLIEANMAKADGKKISVVVKYNLALFRRKLIGSLKLIRKN